MKRNQTDCVVGCGAGARLFSVGCITWDNGNGDLSLVAAHQLEFQCPAWRWRYCDHQRVLVPGAQSCADLRPDHANPADLTIGNASGDSGSQHQDTITFGSGHRDAPVGNAGSAMLVWRLVAPSFITLGEAATGVGSYTLLGDRQHSEYRLGLRHQDRQQRHHGTFTPKPAFFKQRFQAATSTGEPRDKLRHVSERNRQVTANNSTVFVGDAGTGSRQIQSGGTFEGDFSRRRHHPAP